MEGKAGKVGRGGGKLDGPDQPIPTRRTRLLSANIHDPSPLPSPLPHPVSPSSAHPILPARSRSSRRASLSLRSHAADTDLQEENQTGADTSSQNVQVYFSRI